MKGYVAVFVAGLAVFLSGCATDDPSGTNDPYEATNRKIFEMNMSLDRAVMKPVAKAYVQVVPDPVRDSVHNFLTNLDLPVTFANDILQGEFERGGETLARLGVNTTLGIGGLLDIATAAGIPFHTEDFGQTLAVWGSGEGPYIMWPFYGPSNPRDTAGTIVDIGFDPLTYVTWRAKFWYMAGRGALNVIDLRSRSLDQLDSIERSSVDFYASVRSLYRQNRNNEIRNGKPDVTDLPNL